MSIKSKRRKKHKKTWFLIVFVTGAAEHCLGLQRAFHAAIYVNEIVLFSQWSVAQSIKYDHKTLLTPCLHQRNC